MSHSRHSARPSRRRAEAAAIALAAALGAASPAVAQGRDIQGLIDRLTRLEKEVATLNQAVYRGTPPPRAEASPAAPSAAAPVAPPTAPPGIDPRAAARFDTRLNALETELRKLTGRIEEIDHAVRTIDARTEKLVSDVDVRLRALERRSAVAKAEAGEAAAEPAPPQAAGAEAPPQAPGRGAPPRDLGTVSKEDVERVRTAPPPPQTAALPPQEQYDKAYSLLLKAQDFAAAETAFKAFIAAHPDDPLADNAHYWLAETYFVRGEFQQAAYAFADSYQKFPRGNKAPDSLLKLGMSLAKLDKLTEACTAFSRVNENFPQASATLKRRVAMQQRTYKCP